jgi:hypothetical protein
MEHRWRGWHGRTESTPIWSFNWCRLYRAGRLGRRSEVKLLPVRVAGGEFDSGVVVIARTWRLASLLGGHDSHPPAALASARRKRCQSSFVACVVGVSTGMISLPSHTRVWIAAGVTDLRRGFTGLSALMQTKLEQNPLSGQVFIFRGRRPPT